MATAMKTTEADVTARVVGVQDDLVVLETGGDSAAQPIVKNEVVYVCLADGDERLKAEVLRVKGNTAVAQVFEDTRGIRIGDPVEQTGRMLSVTLGPGLLGQVYDGLQNPLE